MSRHDEQSRRQGGSRGGQERGDGAGAYGQGNPGRPEMQQGNMGSWRGGPQMQGQHDSYEDRQFEGQRQGGGSWTQGGSQGGGYGGGEASMSGGRGDLRFGSEGDGAPGYGGDAFRGAGNSNGWNSSNSNHQFSGDYGGRSGEHTGGRGGMQHQGSGQGGQGKPHWDPDYHQWRSEQMKALDDDYDNWRQDRYKKFSSEFSDWRKNRSGQAQGEQADNSDILSPGSGSVGEPASGGQDSKSSKKTG